MALAFSILGPKDSNSLYSYNPPLKGSSKSECALLTLLVPYPCLTLTHIRTTCWITRRRRKKIINSTATKLPNVAVAPHHSATTWRTCHHTTSPLLTTPNSSKLLATLVPLTWIYSGILFKNELSRLLLSGACCLSLLDDCPNCLCMASAPLKLRMTSFWPTLNRLFIGAGWIRGGDLSDAILPGPSPTNLNS
jgi:hypothetical protein